MTFSKSDAAPFVVSLEVFLARSEAILSHFDLRRVVCFTYGHNVHFKQCMPFKRRSMGPNGVLPKREVGDRFCRLGTQLTKNCLGRNSVPLASFRDFLAHRDRVRVAQLSDSDDVGWFHSGVFEKIAIYWVLEGLGTDSGPNRQKKSEPEKSKKG